MPNLRHLFLAGLMAMTPLSGNSAERTRQWAPEATRLQFDAPADTFTQSLPLGNGRQGAMIFGGVTRERVVLNEDTVWSGSRDPEQNRTDAHQALPEIQRLLTEGKPQEAQALVMKTFTCAGKGSGHGNGATVPFGCYQVLGNLLLEFHDTAGEPVEYVRTLNLADAIGTVRYRQGDTTYSREAFVSGPDGILVYHLGADRAGKIGFALSMDRPERATTRVDPDGTLVLEGRTPDGRGGDSVHFVARVRVRHAGGTLHTEDGQLVLEGADTATLLVACETSFHGADPLARTREELAAANGMDVDRLRRRHVADYASYFDRCRIQLPAGDAATLTTPRRRDAFAGGADDPAFAALYYNYGRYLLISSSRPGTQPANLQGVWAEEVQTPWNGDYHLDINVQMNYWPAEVSGLADCHQPLIDLVESLQRPGAETARAYYDAGGWVAHVITNPWGFTAPGEHASWGATSSGTPWLCQHLIDHYAFNPATADASRLFAILKGACQFYLDFLMEDPASGFLVTAPSNSPEVGYIMPDGQRGNVCMGPTVDMQSIRLLFQGTLALATDLDVEAEFRERLAATLPRLAPTRVGADGGIREWLEDWRPQDPHHRHVSHLWGLYPGHEIDPVRSPRLAAAARRTLAMRGDAGTGWSLAHKMLFRARLGEGDHALRLLRLLATPNTQSGIVMHGGGSYDNLFCAHPPFQIDGNFGGAAGVAEMLLQSHRSADGQVEIRLLPALPSTWREGSFDDLRARGNVQVSARWNNAKVRQVTLHAPDGARGELLIHADRTPFDIPPGGTVTVNTGQVDLSVMSFNIRYGTAGNGDNDWGRRKTRVYGIIRDASPDLIGMQEALRFQLDDLRELLPEYGEIGVGRDGGTRGEYSAILYRKNRFEVKDSGTFWLSDTPEVPSVHWGNDCIRICTWGQFSDRDTGRAFYLYNTHLDHVSQPSREKSTRLIADRIRHRTHPDPYIITGDFNAGEDNPCITYLTDGPHENGDAPPRLVDAFRVMHPHDRNVGTFHGFRGRTNGDKIDYVFVPPHIEVVGAGIIRTEDQGRFPSDHFPVTAELRIPARSTRNPSSPSSLPPGELP